jgi:hypothetical protein
VRLAEQVVQLVSLDIDDFKVFVEHAEEEAPFVISLVSLVSGLSWPWYHDLDLRTWESCLREVGPVLAQDDLACVRVALSCRVEGVGDHSVVLLSFWDLLFVCESRA